MAKSDLTAARLRELLHYDPQSGVFTWRVARGCVRAGQMAGSPMKSGYVHFCIDGKFYYAHRLAWLYVHGVWPTGGFVDHRNHNKSDNRIDNLRDATKSVNGENRRVAQKNSHSRLMGAFLAHDGQFTSKIVVRGVRHYLGRFKTAEEAHARYVEAKRRLHEGNTL